MACEPSSIVMASSNLLDVPLISSAYADSCNKQLPCQVTLVNVVGGETLFMPKATITAQVFLQGKETPINSYGNFSRMIRFDRTRGVKSLEQN